MSKSNIFVEISNREIYNKITGIDEKFDKHLINHKDMEKKVQRIQLFAAAALSLTVTLLGVILNLYLKGG